MLRSFHSHSRICEVSFNPVAICRIFVYLQQLYVNLLQEIIQLYDSDSQKNQLQYIQAQEGETPIWSETSSVPVLPTLQLIHLIL